MTEAEKAVISNLVAGAMKELAQDSNEPSKDSGDQTEPE